MGGGWGVEEGLMHLSDASIHKVRLHQGATDALGGLALTQQISDHSCAAGHGGAGGGYGSPRTSPPSLQRINEQLKTFENIPQLPHQLHSFIPH